MDAFHKYQAYKHQGYILCITDDFFSHVEIKNWHIPKIYYVSLNSEISDIMHIC